MRKHTRTYIFSFDCFIQLIINIQFKLISNNFYNFSNILGYYGIALFVKETRTVKHHQENPTWNLFNLNLFSKSAIILTLQTLHFIPQNSSCI